MLGYLISILYNFRTHIINNNNNRNNHNKQWGFTPLVYWIMNINIAETMLTWPYATFHSQFSTDSNKNFDFKVWTLKPDLYFFHVESSEIWYIMKYELRKLNQKLLFRPANKFSLGVKFWKGKLSFICIDACETTQQHKAFFPNWMFLSQCWTTNFAVKIFSLATATPYYVSACCSMGIWLNHLKF